MSAGDPPARGKARRSPAGDLVDLQGSDGKDPRCFWTELRIEGRRVLTFIPQCHGAILDGPEHCTCGELACEVERLEGELRRERRRARTAEEALDRLRRAQAVERVRLQRWRDRVLDHPRELVSERGASERLESRRRPLLRPPEDDPDR